MNNFFAIIEALSGKTGCNRAIYDCGLGGAKSPTASKTLCLSGPARNRKWRFLFLRAYSRRIAGVSTAGSGDSRYWRESPSSGEGGEASALGRTAGGLRGSEGQRMKANPGQSKGWLGLLTKGQICQ